MKKDKKEIKNNDNNPQIITKANDNKSEFKRIYLKKTQKNKTILIIRKLCIGIIVIISIVLLDIGAAYVRFNYDKSHSNFEKSINDTKTLTIVYRPDCRKCRQVLPSLFMRKAFSKKKEYILDARTLTTEQKNELGERSTPAFIFNGESISTTDDIEINHIWSKSH